HPEPPAPLVYDEVGRRLGSRLTPDEIAPRFAAAFALEESRDRELAWRTDEVREIERWRHIVARVLVDVNDPGRGFRGLFDHFSRPEAWRCKDDAGATIEILAKRGYKLGMASNYDRRLRSVAAGLPALQPIQHIVISSEVGWRKPAGPFFSGLCQAM